MLRNVIRSDNVGRCVSFKNSIFEAKCPLRPEWLDKNILYIATIFTKDIEDCYTNFLQVTIFRTIK